MILQERDKERRRVEKERERSDAEREKDKKKKQLPVHLTEIDYDSTVYIKPPSGADRMAFASKAAADSGRPKSPTNEMIPEDPFGGHFPSNFLSSYH